MHTLDRNSLDNVVRRLNVRTGRVLRTAMSTNSALRPLSQMTVQTQKEMVLERVTSFVDAFLEHKRVVEELGHLPNTRIIGLDAVVLEFPDARVVVRMQDRSIRMQVWEASMSPEKHVSPQKLLQTLKARTDLHLLSSFKVRALTSALHRLPRDGDGHGDTDANIYVGTWSAFGEQIPTRLSNEATFKTYLASLRRLQKAGKLWMGGASFATPNAAR